MNLSDIIDNFKNNVKSVSNTWELIDREALSHEKINMLESKLDKIQELNYEIIVDLTRMKNALEITDDQSNNLFLYEKKDNTNYDENMDYINIPHSTFVPLGECVPALSPGYNQDELSEATPSEDHIDHIPLKDSTSQNIEDFNYSIDKFEFVMLDTPKTVVELYADYENNIRNQVALFERLFGKGQMSKINNIRTYQRRRALVCEIQNFSRDFDISIPETLELFESYRLSRSKSVAWLYNNLTKVLPDLRLVLGSELNV